MSNPPCPEPPSRADPRSAQLPPGGAPCARVVADIGGTHARFAWQAGAGQPLEQVEVLPCASYPTLQAALGAYVQLCLGQRRSRPQRMALAIAGPVEGDLVRMTNHPWEFSASALQRDMGLQQLRLLNDFEALALALPTLEAAQLRQVGGGAAKVGKAKALLGAGTGLGVAGLVPVGGPASAAWVAVPGEGGHVTLPAVTPRERWLVDQLALRHGHVSAERVLCGQGLWDTYALLCQLQGRTPACADPAAVSAAALAGRDALAHETLTLWCGLLGSVAGNLALTLGAQGGVYVGGGIVPKLGGWFDRSPFRARFEDKGRFQPYLQAIPVWVIDSPEPPALQGAAAALDH